MVLIFGTIQNRHAPLDRSLGGGVYNTSRNIILAQNTSYGSVLIQRLQLHREQYTGPELVGGQGVLSSLWDLGMESCRCLPEERSLQRGNLYISNACQQLQP